MISRRFARRAVVLGSVVLTPVAARAAAPGWITSCNYSHSLRDDPIVFPEQPGASHLHDFVAARTTDAFSTPDTMRGGGTTCAMPDDMSGYWAPALYAGGKRVLPTATAKDVLVYYRRIAAPSGTTVRPMPDGLRIVVGNGHAKSPSENPTLGNHIIFKCGPGSGTNLPYPPSQCSSGVMVVSIRFPNCWDGVNLDSADHFSHMSYPKGGRCPASHPVVIPRIETFYRYPVGTAPIGTVTFDSGPYYTLHQDFFNAWDPSALQSLVDGCINAGKDCGKNPSVP
jgi:hypothetical protein